MSEQSESASQPSETASKQQETAEAAVTEQDTSAEPQETAVPDFSAEIITLQTQLDTLRNQIKQLEDEKLRTHADMQNTQRRARQDIEKAHKFALEKFATALLDVVDNLERAAENASADDAIHEGVTMTLSALLDVLKKYGVTPVDPIHQAFDPTYHQAVAMLEHAELAANTVMEVLQKGYVLNDRLIRPAMVTVSVGSKNATEQKSAPDA